MEESLRAIFEEQKRGLQQQQLFEQQVDNQRKKDKGPQIDVKSKMPTQLEAPIKSKKTRSYALISSDKIFEKWEKGLCELCDELYVPGHKCKKVSSDYVIIVVDEEVDMRQPDFEVEDPPVVDAHQVLDESPKSNPDISSDDWVGEGQGKMPVGSQNTVCEQLDGLNPSNGLLEQSDLCVQEELGEGAKSGICMEEELPMPAGYSKALGLKFVVPELKDPNLPAHWIPKNLGWKEAIGFCELVYDSGILRLGSSTLQPDIIVFDYVLNAFVPSHQWKAVSWMLEQLKKGGLKTNSATYELAMEVLSKNLKFLCNEAISKLVALGDDENVLLMVVVRNGQCCGGMDVLTYILHNSLSYLNIESCENDGGSKESELVFTDLRQLQLSRGDAMWCPLMSDLQKVELASLYMVGKAETWYNDYVFGRQKVLWEFIKMRQTFDFTNLTWSFLKLYSAPNAAVSPDMVDLLLSEKDKKQFENHLLKSYLISCEEAKCSAPGCEYALLSFGNGDSTNNATHRCLYGFCWMLVNTMPCPNCKLPIEATPGYEYFDYACSRKVCDKQNAIMLAGLGVAGVIPSPFEYTDIVTTATQSEGHFKTSRSAVLALKKLGDGHIHTWLLNTLRKKRHINIKNYCSSLSQLVFSTSAQAANDSLAIFGEDTSYTSELVTWAIKETEQLASRVIQLTLVSTAISGNLRVAAECVHVSLGLCSLLKYRGLALSPVLLKNFKPLVEQALIANLGIAQNTDALAGFDDGSLTLPLGGGGRVASSSPKLSSNTHRCHCMIQDLFEDMEPLETLQLVGPLLEGHVQSFNTYVTILTNALPRSLNKAHQEGIGTSIVKMTETEAQQVALLANALLLADEFLPRAASKFLPTAINEEPSKLVVDRQNRVAEQREWKKQLQRVHLLDKTIGGVLLLKLPRVASNVYEGTRMARETVLAGIRRMIDSFTMVEKGQIIACGAFLPYSEDTCGTVAAIVASSDCCGQGQGDKLFDHIAKKALKKALTLGLEMLSLLTTCTADWVVRHAKETMEGNMRRTLEALRSRLEMEFSYTAQSLPTSAEYAAYKQAVARLIFDPGGQFVAAYIPSWMQGTAAAPYHVLWAGLDEDQNAAIMALSLEDKALKGGSIDAVFSISPIFYHFLSLSLLQISYAELAQTVSC